MIFIYFFVKFWYNARIMSKKIEDITKYFDELYPDPKCELEYGTPYQLLVAVILSAQCTDKRVNQCTRELFRIAPTPTDMLALGAEGIIDIIRPCGFFNQKCKAILQCSKELAESYNGQVPNDFEALTNMRGVGRKTANVVLSTAFGVQAIGVDTHVHRTSRRLGLCSDDSTPYECEMALIHALPPDSLSKMHYQMVLFGRYVCRAKNPQCEGCKLHEHCQYYKEKICL